MKLIEFVEAGDIPVDSKKARKIDSCHGITLYYGAGHPLLCGPEALSSKESSGSSSSKRSNYARETQWAHIWRLLRKSVIQCPHATLLVGRDVL